MKKFICDQMCAKLGRWLRTAGYDTVIIDTPLQDMQIFKKALQEKRLLVTRDKQFKEFDPERKTVIYLRNETLDDWAVQLKDEGVNWLYHPFTRCLECNTPLQKGDLTNEKVPKDVGETFSCPECNHLYWLGSHTQNMENQLKKWQNKTILTIGFGGDLMIGRLVDECLNDVPPSYIWGNLLPLLKKTDLNIVNLETTLTHSTKIVNKVFNFKAHPNRVAALLEGNIHAVNVANNHILDFSEEGLLETLQVLDKHAIKHVGAGSDLKTAMAPCILDRKGIKVGLLGCTDNEPSWEAGASHPGTFYVEVADLTYLKPAIETLRPKVDILILSIHWGPNMRQRPTSQFRAFAHQLIDLGVDILHGHSAHIFQGVEVYKKKLIFYDTGDLVDDYAVDPYLRNDRAFFFLVKVDVDQKRWISLEMIPTLISSFQVNIIDEPEPVELMKKLCEELHTHPVQEDNSLLLT